MIGQPSPTEARERRAPVDRSDVIAGLGSVALGIPVLIYASTMPTLGGAPGPGLFPGIIGALLVIFGVGVLVTALVRTHRPPAATDGGKSTGGAAPAQSDEVDSLPEGSMGEATADDPSPRLSAGIRWMNTAAILGAIIFYILVAEILGFIITMFVVLVAIMMVLRSRLGTALATAAAVTVLLYVVFQQLLLVQLPSGIVG